MIERFPGISRRDIHWAMYSTRLDEHPCDDEHCEHSERQLWKGGRWVEEWEPICAVGQDSMSYGVSSRVAYVVWKRPFVL